MSGIARIHAYGSSVNTHSVPVFGLNNNKFEGYPLQALVQFGFSSQGSGKTLRDLVGE